MEYTSEIRKRWLTIFIELENKDYDNVRHLFKGFDYQVVVRAVIDGTSPGKIWVNDPDHPESGFMSTTEGWFLAGSPEIDEFNQGLRELVHNMILRGDYYSPVNPEFLAELFFHIDAEGWRSKFETIFDIRPPLPSRRMHYICNRVLFDWQDKLPEGYRLLPVNEELNIDSFEVPDDIRQWIGQSLDYQKKRGFGKCLVHGNKIVVWVCADCASGYECEIGIKTTTEYRKKGLGSLTAAATTDSCLSSSYSIVGWHVDELNPASIAVAEKVGFVKERDYVHYICMFNEAVHLAESGLRHFYSNRFEDALSDFEKGFQIGEAPQWAYILAGRASASLNLSDKATEYFVKAKLAGWNEWKWLFDNEELKSKYDAPAWDDLLSQLS